MTIFFTSDTHFNHKGILRWQAERAKRFATLEEMDTFLIDVCNRWVGRNDILYHLGDFCWQASKAGHYRARLKVREFHVIRGNHDASSLRNHCSTFNEILCKKLRGYKVHMCHYPMFSWDSSCHGSLHLYGHSHGSAEDTLDQWMPNRKAMDVGVDAIYKRIGAYRPIALEEILEIVNG